jgi:hypothetical protein
MKKQLSALFTGAIVSGLLAGSIVNAEEKKEDNAGGDKVASEKSNCSGKAEGKHSCKGKDAKKAKKDKHSCKGGCSEKMMNQEKTDDSKKEESKDK